MESPVIYILCRLFRNEIGHIQLWPRTLLLTQTKTWILREAPTHDTVHFVWKAKSTETQILWELSIEIESSLIELKSSLFELKISLIQLESSLIQL